MKTVTLFAVLAGSLVLFGCAEPQIRLDHPTSSGLHSLTLPAQIVRCNARLRDLAFNSQVIVIAGKECLAQSSPTFHSCIMAAETMNYIMNIELNQQVAECAKARRLEASLVAEAMPAIEESGRVARRLAAKFR